MGSEIERLNINYPLSGSARSLALGLNGWYGKGGGTGIVFSDKGPYPHITLLMGETRREHRDDLIQRLRVLAKDVPHSPLHLTFPRRPALDSGYVFLGIEQEDAVRKVKAQIAEQLQDIFTPGEYGGIDTAPHVTVAFFTSPERYLVFPRAAFREITWVPEHIAISETGAYGTCVNILESFSLAQ